MDINVALKAFIRTVEKGSITAAARDLGVTQPAVTKHISNLERHVQARLLERSSKIVRPTAHGLELYEASRMAIASIDAALEGVRINTGEIEGNLRIHAPSCIGVGHLERIVGEFQDEYCGISVELALDERTIDLVYDNFDLSLHYGKIEDQEVIVRRIGWVERFLVASPRYLKQVGEIEDKQRLSELEVIGTPKMLAQRSTISLLGPSGRAEDVIVRPILTTNNAHVMIAALLRGRGVGLVQKNLVLDLLASGELVRVLPEYWLRSTEAFLAYPSTKFMRPVVRAFTDFVMPRLRAIEGISSEQR
ncbi:DNA-binding transcriptional LysR family regulator [Phyllobacterium ifriqiyense]|uniref:DNA-binding transcriptional LysR family regulator n=1 Tax=Phyllobacterium ifriqiyense TaxID=314238 RepID=A0ABU0S958_9HYPH|nr:LysR family transcriptional regulator [Phyllobacterium ifriqiyense]MDQ0996263.1 DNA-binding transcriptional LysR family regulator [Phyllobacterium ifriqiyense]